MRSFEGHFPPKSFETLNCLAINPIDGNKKSVTNLYAENTDLHRSLDLEIVSKYDLYGFGV